MRGLEAVLHTCLRERRPQETFRGLLWASRPGVPLFCHATPPRLQCWDVAGGQSQAASRTNPHTVQCSGHSQTPSRGFGSEAVAQGHGEVGELGGEGTAVIPEPPSLRGTVFLCCFLGGEWRGQGGLVTLSMLPPRGPPRMSSWTDSQLSPSVSCVPVRDADP